MQPHEIKAELIKARIKQIDVAKSLGIDKSTVSGVISGMRNSERVRVYISKQLKVPYETLWGTPQR